MSASGMDWSEANQRLLIAEFARLEARLAGADAAAAAGALAEARAALQGPAAIDRVTHAFGLTPFERDLLLLCAGVEMSDALAAQCAAADQEGRACVSFSLALAKLESPHWSALAPIRPLRLWRLLEVRDEHALVRSRLAIDERVLHFLAGLNYLDPRLRPLLESYVGSAAACAGHAETIATVTRLLREAEGAAPVIQLLGDDATAQRDVAWAIAEALGLRLHVLRLAGTSMSAHESDALCILWQRESALLPGALLIEQDEAAGAAAATRLLEHSGGPTFIAARQPMGFDRPELRFTVDRPGCAEQKRLWVEALGPAAARLNGALDGLTTQFRLNSATIARTAAALRPCLEAAAAPDAALWQACRAAVRSGLDGLAQRIAPTASWDDLILPEPQLAMLHQIASHVRQRLRVYEDWGFASKSARGLGISALFAGESGTGKTMAAEVLANELHLDLYRIDLAATVSKYIGETEKNLRRVFDAAEDSGAILLFDEADALFGRRSEVKDSHDRYANIEVSYLLQRMEAYRGLAILTTNLKSSLDPAFQRRLRFAVEFPFPDQEQRERIWRGIFPASAPLEGIDPARLARLNVAGGSIRNIALHAAFLAAEARTPLGMAYVLQAARSEAAKRDRPFSDAETRGWL